MIDTLIFNNNCSAYETERLFRTFFPPQKLNLIIDGTIPEDNFFLAAERDGNVIVHIKDGDVNILLTENVHGKTKHEIQLVFSHVCCKALEKYTGKSLGWGILTGIRPVKYIEKAITDKGEGYIRDFLLVKENKLDIAKRIIKIQKDIFASMTKNSFSLYVSIPFCPSRCSYCSFVSHSVENSAKLIPDYIKLLSDEIKATGETVRKLGLTLDTVYFGGGTPTSLTAKQLEFLFEAVESSFDLSSVREYTVEAGRPDTITEEKLRAIKTAGAGRISINPQTMNDIVLNVIGRKHTVKQTLDAFELAHKIGFSSINADLIAGLPSDTVQSFENSIRQIIAVTTENITVHTLTLKRSSTLYHENNIALTDEIQEMVEFAAENLITVGYNPYYLYKQNNSLGANENIGYALTGKESLYNTYIMEEIQPIFAVGCGGSTKLIDKNGKISRIFNLKYPYEYINRFDEIIAHKDEIYSFYESERKG